MMVRSFNHSFIFPDHVFFFATEDSFFSLVKTANSLPSKMQWVKMRTTPKPI